MEGLSLNSYSAGVLVSLHAAWRTGAGLCLWGDPARQLGQGQLLSLRLQLPQPSQPVAGWALSHVEALQLPGQLRGTTLPLAPDARALLNVTWLLLRQLAAGQLYPHLHRAGTRWQARWKPHGWDIDALATSIPRAALSAVPDGLDQPPPPSVVVADMLDTLTDAAARLALSSVGPPLKVRKRQAAGRWVMALHDKRPVVQADPDKVDVFADTLRDWRPPAPPARLSMRLEPPAGDSPWLLHLGRVDATGKTTPAADVWAQPAWQPKADLLVGISQAAALLPALEALRGATPAVLTLLREDAERFLHDAADRLEAAGVVVQRPALWQAPLTPRAQLQSHIGVDGILEFDWQIALGGAPITAEELARLAAQKSALVRHRGKWVRVQQEAIAQIAEDVDSDGMEAMRRASVSPLVAMADGPLQALFSGQRPPPKTSSERFDGTLRPYQAAGLGWLDALAGMGLGACLADDMGLGKTVQVLAHLCESGGKTLLVCPLSVLINWQREAARFTPHLTVALHHGPRRVGLDGFSALMAGCDVLVTTYAVARSDAEMLGTLRWDRIILDEAQHIKNPQTATSKAIRGLPARHRIAMTGTPVENRLEELWAIFDFLSPGLLGSRSSFKARYATPIEKNGNPLIAETLRRLTAPFLLRRRKTDPDIASDLPPKVEIVENCTLTIEQAALYRAQLEEIRGRLREADAAGGDDADAKRRTVILGALTRLKQICNHPAQFLHEPGPLANRSGKLRRLESLLETILAAGEQVLIFTQYTAAASLLRDRIFDRFRQEPLYLHGGLSHAQRQAQIDRFQAGEAQIFLLSLKAAGTGLTLTAASHVVHYDRWWNPAVEDQATDRAWRLGQKRQVQVRKLICVGTIEERIDALIASKRALADEVINIRGPSGLSTAELEGLVRGIDAG